MIDLHCHILPGVDDGPVGLDESLVMARTAAGQGIRTVVATPHTLNGHYMNTPADIAARVEKFQRRLATEKISLTVLPGAEIGFTQGLAGHLDAGDVPTMNNKGRYLLLELNSLCMLSKVKEEIFALRLHGYIPVIAHPERYLFLKGGTEAVRDWVRMGAICQLTAQSIIGSFGRPVQHFAEKILRARLAHVIASDAHSAITRTPTLVQAVEQAAAVLGDMAAAERMVAAAPQAIIQGKVFEVEEPVFRKTWWPGWVSTRRRPAANPWPEMTKGFFH